MSDHDVLIVQLENLGRGDLALAGGKGANLGELLKGGFNVPPGFVVTTRSYRDAMNDAALADVSASQLSPAGAAALRGRMRAMDIPAAVSSAILDAYRGLGGGAVAVRSSATAEDQPGATFAGQQDTFLNIIGEQAVLDSVRACWASLFTERAVAYRARAGFDPHGVEIAVVVQRMVDADTAGVMFTVNPVTGVRDETVIDASPGLGESVVSGLVTPDHFVLGRDLRIRQRHLGRREVVLQARAGGGVEERSDGSPVPHLDPATLADLAVIGARIAVHFGVPQDIEWAIAGSTVWVVQARPLTAVPPAPMRVNAVRRKITAVVSEMLPIRPYPLDMTTWTVNGVGRILTRMMAELPGIRLSIEDVLPEVDGVVERLVPPDPRPTLRTLSTPFRLRARAHRNRPERWRSDPRYTEFERNVAALNSVQVHELVWAELIAVPHRALQTLDRLSDIRIDYLPRAGLDLVRLRLLLSVLGLNREYPNLIRGVRTRTSDANEALAALSRTIQVEPTWRDAFTTLEDDELTEQLETSEALDPLRERIAGFLQEYGHRETTSALLVSQPTWSQDPATLFSALRGLIASVGYEHAADGPTSDLEKRILRSRRVRLLGAGRRILALASGARAGIAFREDTHFDALRPLPSLRRALLEAGRRLADVGILHEAGDVFHLRLDEITELPDPSTASSEHRDALASRVEHRKSRRASLSGAPLVSPLTLHPARAESSSAVSGTPAGGGKVSGTVRIIRQPSEFGRLQAGEILVCPYTNPSWTSLFQLAGGVVVDSGGLASHAAIVAREYGLPTVMGTGNGTLLLRDGQTVTVDGTTGLVTLEDHA